MIRRRFGHVLALVAIACALGTAPAATPDAGFPPLVFVSRQPLGASATVPGCGPIGRTAAAGGRLLVRKSDGTIAPLVPRSRFFDVADPSVSWDGRRVAFAGLVGPDSAWRIFTVRADGRGLAQVTHTDRATDLAPLGKGATHFARYDDFDPCWLPDGRIAFASTRFPMVAEQGGLASNLYAVRADGGHLIRLTTERNGGEEPSVDPTTGRVVFARWWFSRYLPADSDARGITLDRARAVPADPVDLWHAITMTTEGNGLRLAGGNPRVREETAAYQPIVLGDETLIGVRAEHGSLLPDGGRLQLVMFRHRFSAPTPAPKALAAASALAPAALPDGRVVFSSDLHHRGDFGLYAFRPGRETVAKILDLPGTLELDAAPLVARRKPPVLIVDLLEQPRSLPVQTEAELHEDMSTFRFDCLNVFANAAVDAPFPDAPPLEKGVKIRFFGVLARPEKEGGDTLVLVRESDLTPAGAVHEDNMPADTPMFEQLVDAHGHVLRSTSGPAHVPGFNSGRFGTGTRCVGCHIGHSALPVANSYFTGKWLNASTSAEVTASSSAPGSAGPRAAVDRRAKGPVREVAWVADRADHQTLRLQWRTLIEVTSCVLYSVSPKPSEGTDLRVLKSELVFYREGREVARKSVSRELAPGGLRVDVGDVVTDAIEFRPLRATGGIRHQPAVALAEFETIARLPEH